MPFTDFFILFNNDCSYKNSQIMTLWATLSPRHMHGRTEATTVAWTEDLFLRGPNSPSSSSCSRVGSIMAPLAATTVRWHPHLAHAGYPPPVWQVQSDSDI
jgi:hypothetical protein